MTTDRLSDGYEPDFDVDIEFGAQGELYVMGIINELKSGSVEVKNDAMASKFRNVYIECSCERRDGWHRSGIRTTGADFWAHILAGEVVVIAPTERWRNLAKRHWGDPNYERDMPRGSHPTRGLVFPLSRLLTELMAEDGDQ